MSDNKHKIVIIIWHDSHTPERGWLNLEDVLLSSTPYVINTVGYLLEENEVSVLVAHSISLDEEVMGVISIPRGCIQNMFSVEKIDTCPEKTQN